MKVNNGKMTDVQQAILQDGGSTPANNFVRNSFIIQRK